jgi:ribose transport system ATP-binding protein
MDDSYVLEMLNIRKKFPGVKALEDVTLQVKNREIHGIVGENGAGKSTLMKILAGIYEQDTGEIKINGQCQKHLTTKSVEKLKIHFIHQERYIVPHLTVAESLFLGIEPAYSPLKLLNRKFMVKESERLLKEKLGVTIQGNRLMWNLTVGEQQLVQICRALLNEPKLIVFDEPTAVLPKYEADRLFQIIKELGKNISIIYISHYLREVLELCDRITVLKNGKKVRTLESGGLNVEDIVKVMTGKDIKRRYPSKKMPQNKVLLEIKDLTHIKVFKNISFKMNKGEIIAITGLMGSGHIELGRAIYDTSGVVSGSIEFNGRKLLQNRPETAVQLGMAYVPQDRRKLGIIQNMSVCHNITISNLKSVSRKGIVNTLEENTRAKNIIEKLGIKTSGQETSAGLLSGGNQQKVAIGKWMNSESKLYIFNELTSGVDIGAKIEIYSIINKMAEQGAGIILISQDIQEMVGLSDRILVMYRGEIVDEFIGGNMNTNEIFVSMMGGKSDAVVNGA